MRRLRCLLLALLLGGCSGGDGDPSGIFTGHSSGTVTGNANPSPNLDFGLDPASSFPVSLINKSGVDDDEIYVTIIGQTSPGNWAWVDQNGTPHPLDHTAADALGHLTTNGVNYANMSFTLDEAEKLGIPQEFQGGRIYLSAKNPLYIAIRLDDDGWTEPDPADEADPNFETTYDRYELTFKEGAIAFAGNTTQTDQFGVPLLVTLEQTSGGFSGTRGLTQLREEVFENFATTVPAAFQALVIKDTGGNPIRILAPGTSPPAIVTWMDPPVDDFWTKYKSTAFVYDGPDYRVNGGVDAGDQFRYTVTATDGTATTYTIEQPTSAEVFAATGPFVGVGLQGAFLAQLNAAFNRGVATMPPSWGNESAYYPPGQRFNEYSAFFHRLGLANDAYGFPHDDVNDQSGVLILDNSQPPTLLTISIS